MHPVPLSQTPKCPILPLLGSLELLTELPPPHRPPPLHCFLTGFPRLPLSPPYTSLRVRKSVDLLLSAEPFAEMQSRNCSLNINYKYVSLVCFWFLVWLVTDYKSCHGSVQSLMSLDPQEATHMRKSSRIRCGSDLTSKHSVSSNGYQRPGSLWVPVKWFYIKVV